MTNLLQEILLKIELEKLIEEGKDPVEVINYKFQNVPQDIRDGVIRLDPTKKKSYTQWLLGKWGNEANIISLYLKTGKIEELFNYFKSHQEIQLKDMPSVDAAVRNFIPDEDTVLGKSNKPKTYVKNLDSEVDSELANDFDVIFNQDNWIIAVPNTLEASCKLGENMKWCTANEFGNADYYYSHYLSKGGKYYINFDLSGEECAKGKDYPYKRYQFHFETGQLMDLNNERVDPFGIGIPKSAIEFYKSIGYDLKNYVDRKVRAKRYNKERNEFKLDILGGRASLNIEYNHNFELIEPTEDTKFYLYGYTDNIDPVTKTSFKNPHVHNVFKFNGDGGVCLYGNNEDSNETILVAAGLDTDTSYGAFSWFDSLSANFLELENAVVAFEDDEDFSCIVTKNGLTTLKCQFSNAFKNTKISDSSGSEFFETVNKNGIHSLIRINDSLPRGFEFTILGDIPEDGKQFSFDEKGVINGRFKSYSLNQENEENQFGFAKKIKDGMFVIFNEKNEYGILKDGEFQSQFGWFKEFEECAYGHTLLKGKHFAGLFDRNGELIAKSKCIYANKTKDFVEFCDERCYRIFNLKNYSPSTKFEKIDSFYSSYSKVPVFIRDEKLDPYMFSDEYEYEQKKYIVKLYDYREKKFCFEESKKKKFITSIGNCIHPYIVLDSSINNRLMALYDVKSEKIIADGFTWLSFGNGFGDKFKLMEFDDSKVNALDIKNGKMLFSEPMPLAYDYSDNGLYVFEVNGMYVPFTMKRGDFSHYTEISDKQYGSKIPMHWADKRLFYCEYKNYILYVNDSSSENRFEWSTAQESGTTNPINNGAEIPPKEVCEAYNLVTGKNIEEDFEFNTSGVNEVRCAFKQLLDRMDKSFKKRL